MVVVVCGFFKVVVVFCGIVEVVVGIVMTGGGGVCIRELGGGVVGAMSDEPKTLTNSCCAAG